MKFDDKCLENYPVSKEEIRQYNNKHKSTLCNKNYIEKATYILSEITREYDDGDIEIVFNKS